MPRPRRDGTPATAPNKAKLNDLLLKRLRPQPRPYVVWDTYQRGLAVRDMTKLSPAAQAFVKVAREMYSGRKPRSA